MVDDDSGTRDVTDEASSVSDSSRDEADAQWNDSSTWDGSDSWSGTDGDETETESNDRIPLDLSSGRDDDMADDGTAADADDDESDHYQPEPSSTPIEAGDPDLENAVFVVIGAIAMLLVLARLVSLPL